MAPLRNVSQQNKIVIMEKKLSSNESVWETSFNNNMQLHHFLHDNTPGCLCGIH